MKSRGENLEKAMDQALGYYLQLKKDQEPRYILVCDFQSWYLRDKKENTDHFFILSELVENIGLFGFMTNRPKVIQSDPVNIKASEILGKIFDALKKSGYPHHQVEYFLTRLVFCLFADDTGIFGDNGKFQSYIKNSTQEDGSDLGRYLAYLFGVLNQERDKRSKTMDSKTRSFPYINGALFEKQIDFPDFDSNMRELLIDAGNYDWSKVSPAIFGNMFQTVMDQDARREMGAHYTSEENILKVIRPLFLDDLNKEYDELSKVMDDSKKDGFIEFQNKLANLKFLDPACGSGNFLVIAYREIRRLEHRIIMKIYGYEGKRTDTDELSKVDVNQFHGIEIIEFSSRITEISLWMMDHIMNLELSDRYGYKFRRIPIKKKPFIVNRDALEFDWNDVIPSEQCSYIFGNPPFSGSNTMTEEQRNQVKTIANLGKSGGTLDYVTAWFITAGKYVKDDTKIGFVATNSIVQGEQVGQLWPILFEYDLQITFAYKSFKWNSESRGGATVTVVIIGLTKTGTTKRLFDYDANNTIEHNPKNISPYLVETTNPHIIVYKTSNPINGLQKIKKGTMPIDGGHYIFTDSEKNTFLENEPDAESFFRPYINGKEFLNGKSRWILKLHDAQPNQLRKMPKITQQISKVREFRLASKNKITRKLAETPKIFAHTHIPTTSFLAIPIISSSRRKYVPIGYMKPPIIPSDATMIIENASLGLLGLITSKMHMVWLRSIGGKLGTSLRYSGGVVYNTFPVPSGNLNELEPYAKKILDIRDKYPDSTLADLYDPITMPVDLLKAHKSLDKIVERLYREKPFESDNERLEFLLKEYQKMTSKQATL